ncbi:5-carboxymethyl-2-hydroxymuconate Delta-isomerase [Ralstonia mannitolilytica]|uniref:5-carboxymethyl-2-hydroxymuconate Delta-isomerase n=1 Tax=Ralstonia mannitolilytica TaxID=105219 RepID=UPI0028F50974|nr:5-carboxymethyl-2-hydroxymuconate Delta-isomerase [Ralstonia mannitolilytica]CAJ0711730.1 5-carboxymethyl-2-hydroxymuconate Delta-isomerase [Ralstonia mannitolilytica]
MPHVIIEYTANVEADARISELMRVLSDVLIRHADVFPIGGIRTRALRLDQYRMVDGSEDDAFIHVTFRIKAGRPRSVTGPVCAEMFAAARAHLADVFARRFLGLTLELVEFDTHGFHVENNVHARFARAPQPLPGQIS